MSTSVQNKLTFYPDFNVAATGFDKIKDKLVVDAQSGQMDLYIGKSESGTVVYQDKPDASWTSEQVSQVSKSFDWSQDGIADDIVGFSQGAHAQWGFDVAIHGVSYAQLIKKLDCHAHGAHAHCDVNGDGIEDEASKQADASANVHIASAR